MAGMRKVSMATRDELVEALSRRYGMSGREEKTRILNPDFSPKNSVESDYLL